MISPFRPTRDPEFRIGVDETLDIGLSRMDSRATAVRPGTTTETPPLSLTTTTNFAQGLFCPPSEVPSFRTFPYSCSRRLVINFVSFVALRLLLVWSTCKCPCSAERVPTASRKETGLGIRAHEPLVSSVRDIDRAETVLDSAW